MRTSRAPLIGGLATDLAGMRAALALADRAGGIVDHLHGEALLRNFLTLQDAGWVTTTLTEVRNRADLILFVGTDTSEFPRFFERCIDNQSALFKPSPADRELVFIGEGLRPGRHGRRRPQNLRCDTAHLGEVVDALRALVGGHRLAARSIAGIEQARLARLAERLRAARYAVVVWSAGRLEIAHGNLLVQSLCALVRELNETTRAAGLPLGGDDGGATAAAVCAWQSGFPLRVDFGPGYPRYDPVGNASARLLADGCVDALVWIGSFNASQTPPATRVPRIVIGHPGLTCSPAPQVFIPVGTPGVDHSGHLVRCDAVVTLPLARVRASTLPHAAAVLDAIRAALD
ncbi:MAG: formylmethanofuran dehydrogenase subunit B [Gammaproteobacteria bacterium]|nr:formylmethanofuran dehydrogenase subunit B [Gammaproteobacteria bacterium]